MKLRMFILLKEMLIQTFFDDVDGGDNPCSVVLFERKGLVKLHRATCSGAARSRVAWNAYKLDAWTGRKPQCIALSVAETCECDG